ncbi:winged helix-turn-helix transcriptional regulator [Subtercola sp. YIM 133946]|uniref:winged helix-turn-helix transcriptional regulator n=1 Tax=Subtercola sp. YIM 133946 TaxID=3118909 RepID=UPI002F9284D1
MENTSLHRCDAAVTLAFSLLGKRWVGMIISTLGAGEMSFTDVRRAVTGISDAVLSDRLAELTRLGLVERRVNDGPPVSVVYRLAASGEQLVPLLSELGVWAQSNLPAE